MSYLTLPSLTLPYKPYFLPYLTSYITIPYILPYLIS